MFVLTLSLISFCIFSLPTRPSLRTENGRRRYLLTGARGGEKNNRFRFSLRPERACVSGVNLSWSETSRHRDSSSWQNLERWMAETKSRSVTRPDPMTENIYTSVFARAPGCTKRLECLDVSEKPYKTPRLRAASMSERIFRGFVLVFDELYISTQNEYLYIHKY